ncbi:class I SAM-dependent methyltransferase [Candidatus Woesearchaeota archaeon]|nr:class I SAM-dependent methyltransferase [Candidatus Woesearchaeota archaeon]
MSEHYYARKHKTAFTRSLIHAHLRGADFVFETGAGTFSKTRIDKGTQLLIDEFIVTPGMRILDLGCGYGPAGIAIKKTCSQCTVVLTDVNKRAVTLTKKNAALNGVEVDVRSGDSYEPVKDEFFDAILLNPPQTAGRELCNQMIEHGKARLDTDGEFWLVARHNVGGRMFEQKMEEVYGNVETIARQSGYRVYRSKKT